MTTAAQIAEALEADGHDPNTTIGSIWEDQKAARYLPDNHVRLVKVTSIGNTVSGWQARVRAYHGLEPADWLEANDGVIHVKTLEAEYVRRANAR
jgi:hypothetical protein